MGSCQLWFRSNHGEDSMLEILLFLILLVLVVAFLPNIAKFVVSLILVSCAIIGLIVLVGVFI
jgi:hypothetical protein